MKIRYCIVLIGLCSFFNLSIALASYELSENQHQTSAHSFKELRKPKNIGAMVWLRDLEEKRNQANHQGELEVFKWVTLEISATIGGKYGISTRHATPKERAELIHSITFTRHVFSSEQEMLTGGYGMNNVKNLPAHHQEHLAAIWAIDTMAAKAIADDTFAKQWASISETVPIAQNFINSVAQHAKIIDSTAVATALESSLGLFLQKQRSTIALASAIFESQLLYVANNNTPEKLFIRGIAGARKATNLGVLQAKDAQAQGLLHYAYLLFSGENSFGKNISKSVEVCKEAADLGNKEAKDKLPIFLNSYAADLFNGTNGVVKNIPRSIEYFGKATALGDEKAKNNMLTVLCKYAVLLFNGGEGIKRDIPKAIDTFREATKLGSKTAKIDLAKALSIYSYWLFNGVEGIEQNISKAIEVCKEAAELGSEDAKNNLPIFLEAQDFKGNWTKIFQTKVGPILHTPEMTQFGGMTCGKGINLNCKTYNDFTLLAPLVLKTNSTADEFLAALRISGLVD